MNKLNKLIEKSRSFDEHKEDHMAWRLGVTFDENCRMHIPKGVEDALELGLTDWALGQLCTKLKVPPGYARRCPEPLRAVNLSWWTRAQSADDYLFVREYDGEARAVLGQGYGVINNTDVLEMAKEFLADRQYRIIRPYVAANTVHVRFSICDTDVGGNGNYGVGFYLGNGEIGNRYGRFLPYIQRTSCDNSIVYSKAGVRMMHRNTSFSFFKATVLQKAGEVLGFAADMVQRMIDAKIEQMPKFSDIVTRICKAKGLREEVMTAIHVGAEGSMTRAGLVNGLSFAAHHIPDEDRRTDLETLAGAILCEPESLFGKVLKRQYAEVLR